MKHDILELFAKRHSFYELNNTVPISDEKIRNLIKENIKLYPSPFNSQSARLVLLSQENHTKFWDIVSQTLISVAPNDKIDAISEKIAMFAQAYGTILFYVDKSIIQSLKVKFPLYSKSFENWSYQANAILQFMIWTTLADNMIGANLQHYNPVIDEKVRNAFDISSDWELVAQMPFGGIISTPSAHTVENIDNSFIIK